jgi:uncharacterized protein YcfL
MEKKMKNFVLLSIVSCCIAGCPGKDPVATDSTVSAVVTAEAAPSAVPTATASAAVEAAPAPSASASAAPVEKK